LLLVVIAGVSTAFMMASKSPVLLRIPYHRNQLSGDYNYVLFNPLRDRLPERAAAAYLDAMRRGNCSDASALAQNPSMPNDLTCEQLQQEESKYQWLFVQPLRDRREVTGAVFLYYSTTGYEGNWIQVRNTPAGWRVVGFNKIW